VLEEQDLDEEESEHPSYAESLEEDEFEMEEETLGGQMAANPPATAVLPSKASLRFLPRS